MGLVPLTRSNSLRDRWARAWALRTACSRGGTHTRARHDNGVPVDVLAQRDNGHMIRRGDAPRGLCAVVGCRHSNGVCRSLRNSSRPRDPRSCHDDRKGHRDNCEHEHQQDDGTAGVASIGARRRDHQISIHDFSRHTAHRAQSTGLMGRSRYEPTAMRAPRTRRRHRCRRRRPKMYAISPTRPRR